MVSWYSHQHQPEVPLYKQIENVEGFIEEINDKLRNGNLDYFQDRSYHAFKDGHIDTFDQAKEYARPIIEDAKRQLQTLKRRREEEGGEQDDPLSLPKKHTTLDCYLARMGARKKKVEQLLQSYNRQANAGENDVDTDRFMSIYDDETYPVMWCDHQSSERHMQVHPRTKRAIGIKIHALHEIVDNLLLPQEQQTDNPGINVILNDIFKRIATMIRTSPAGKYDIIKYSHDPTVYAKGDDPDLVGWINPPLVATKGGAKRNRNSTHNSKNKNKTSKRANKKKKTIKSKSKRRPRSRKY